MRTRHAVDTAAAPSPGIGPNNTPLETYAQPPSKLAESIGLPAETLDALSRHGKGPPIFKIGRRWFCRRSDFHAWIDACASGRINATLVDKRRHVAPPEVLTPPPRERRPSEADGAKRQHRDVAERRSKRGEDRTGAS
jgi:hypothetical protein